MKDEELASEIAATRASGVKWVSLRPDDADDLLAELATLRARLAASEAVLRTLEWSRVGDSAKWPPLPSQLCPTCRRSSEQGHAAGCSLAAALAAAPATDPTVKDRLTVAAPATGAVSIHFTDEQCAYLDRIRAWHRESANSTVELGRTAPATGADEGRGDEGLARLQAFLAELGWTREFGAAVLGFETPIAPEDVSSLVAALPHLPPAAPSAPSPAGAGEREAQRRSFAHGNAKLANPDITREAIDKAAGDLAAAVARENA